MPGKTIFCYSETSEHPWLWANIEGCTYFHGSSALHIHFCVLYNREHLEGTMIQFSTHQFCNWAAIFCWIILFKQSQEEEESWQQTYRLWVQGPWPILRWRSTLKWMANLGLFNVKPCPKENFKPESRVVWTKSPRVDTDWPEILGTISSSSVPEMSHGSHATTLHYDETWIKIVIMHGAKELQQELHIISNRTEDPVLRF